MNMTRVIAFGGKFNLTYSKGNLGYYPNNADVLKSDLHELYGDKHTYDELFFGDGTDMELGDKENLIQYLLGHKKSEKVVLLASSAFARYLSEYITKHLPDNYTPKIGIVGSSAPYIIKGGDAAVRLKKMDDYLNEVETGIYYYEKDQSDHIVKYVLPVVKEDVSI